MNEVAKIEAETQEINLPIDPMVSMIERVAMDQNADIAKLERMLEMKEKVDAQSAKARFDAAFSKASAAFPDIPLNGENKHQKTRYALLKDILSGVRPILSQHGLALSFSTEVDKDFVTVTAELSHEGGHSKRNSIPLPRDAGAGRNAVQAVGSSQTYGQRYTAQAILGLSLGEDTEDDGNSANTVQERKPDRDPWINTVLQDMPESATDRDKAQAVAQAICSQWKRKKSVGQLDNEWDRRAKTIDALEERHPDLFEVVSEQYDLRRNDLIEAQREKERVD